LMFGFIYIISNYQTQVLGIFKCWTSEKGLAETIFLINHFLRGLDTQTFLSQFPVVNTTLTLIYLTLNPQQTNFFIMILILDPNGQSRFNFSRFGVGQ